MMPAATCAVRACAVLLLLRAVGGCTTFFAGPAATTDGSVLSVQSNDGAGDRVGNLVKRPAAKHPKGSIRPPGVPQVAETYAYYSTGYAVMNEWQVGMSESTTSAVYTGNGSALLSIVDLEEIALERSKTAAAAVETMGALAERYGFYGSADTSGSGESVIVSDTASGWVFHVLPDSAGTGAVWAAQRVPDGHVAVVANCFIIREVGLGQSDFKYSANLKAEAARRGWEEGTPLDFTALFSDGEAGHKYSSGRRTWRIFSLVAPAVPLSPYYDDLIASRPYPFSLPPANNLAPADFFRIMRDHYDGTEFDLASGLAAGPFGAPARWTGTPGNVSGWWERPISYHGTIITTVLQSRGWLDNAVGGVVYAAAHSTDTACFTPFAVGVHDLPDSVTNASGTLTRAHAWWSYLILYNTVQLKYAYMIPHVRQLQGELEAASVRLVDTLTAQYMNDRNVARLTEGFSANADAVVARFAALSDTLVQEFPDGYCNDCGLADHVLPYPAWWLHAVGYSSPKGGTTPPPRGATDCVLQCDDTTLERYKRCVKACHGV